MKKPGLIILANMCAVVITPMVIPYTAYAEGGDTVILEEVANDIPDTAVITDAKEQDIQEAVETEESGDIDTSADSGTENIIKTLEKDTQKDSDENGTKVNDDQNENLSIPDPSKYKEIKIEGDKIYVSIKGNEWINRNGYWHFVKDGELVKGWRNMTKADGEKTAHMSYFDKTNGRLYTGWHKMGKAEGEKTAHYSYFGKNGWLQTGWKKFTKADGEKTEHYSYFGKNGWLQTGWKKFTKADGEKTEHYSYFGKNGWLQTGWKCFTKSDGEKSPHWSYFGKDGWMQTGWKKFTKADGEKTDHLSYFGENGWMRTGMQTMGTNINPDGKSKIHISYFGNNGWLVVDKLFTYNKEQYLSDKNGWLKKIETESDRVLVRAMQLVEKVTNNSMTKEQKLWACYVHIRDSYPEYNPRIPHFAGEGWHTLYANDIFVGKDGKKGGNCISVGAAFAYMAKAIGYENVYAVNGTGHGWAEVDNKVYDAEWERHNKGSYYGLSYEPVAGKPNYKWIFSSSNPYARIKL